MYVRGHEGAHVLVFLYAYLSGHVCACVWVCVLSAPSYRQAILSWWPQSHLDLVGWKHRLLNFQGATLSYTYILSQKYTCFLGPSDTPPSWVERPFQNTKCSAQQIFDPERVNHKTGACEPAQWWEKAFREGQGRSLQQSLTTHLRPAFINQPSLLYFFFFFCAVVSTRTRGLLHLASENLPGFFFNSRSATWRTLFVWSSRGMKLDTSTLGLDLQHLNFADQSGRVYFREHLRNMHNLQSKCVV